MAPTDLKWSLSQIKTFIWSLMVLMSLHTVTGNSHTYVLNIFWSKEILTRMHLSTFKNVYIFIFVAGMSGWDGCLDGQDVFATVRENSPSGEIVAELLTDTTMEGVHWSLNGKDADWFLLDGRNIRLNTSTDKVLDREVKIFLVKH